MEHPFVPPLRISPSLLHDSFASRPCLLCIQGLSSRRMIRVAVPDPGLCGRCGNSHAALRRTVLLSSASTLLGRVNLVHHDETCEPSGLRSRWHVRERRILGIVRRSAMSCDSFASEDDAILPSLRVLRWIP